ncbi:glycosyltransferase [Haladaptatus sp. YSMS36]|uniref:glycosyltransferase n=1 Tax=Haladaptatus sp. YSMS36 TaxID=3033384 RepID=UPI0023E8F472|nr:glycosyltransferase [Haladaptatus sp. YSMS36]
MDLTVGHFKHTYLSLTETFIYQYITNHERYEPFVASMRKENIENFPFQPRHTFLDHPRWSLRFLIYGGLAKLNIRELSQTYFGHIVNKTNPDILHAHFGPMGVELLPHRTPERPLVTTFYGYDTSMAVKDNESIRADYQRLFETGDLFLVEGPSMQEKLQTLGCPEEKIGLQRIAIDPSQITPQFPGERDSWRILLVGSFVEKKGIPDGIRAFASAFSDTENAELRIVGGEVRDLTKADLERLAAEHGVEDKVTFTGFLDYGEYLKEVRECTLLLAPSKTAESGDSEGGAPTVLLEAQASGKPVVTTTHADIPYVVEEGVAGKLVTPGNVSELSDALRWCRDHPKRFNQLGRAGRENMEQHHDITELATQLEQRYDRLL